MDLLTVDSDRKLLPAEPPQAPVLRVRRERDPRIETVRLTPGKCTLGSSPQCHVRLASADVRPLQCVIVMEGSAASVTRWAAGVQLNGRDFSKAELVHGDRLTIGGWEVQFDRPGHSPSGSAGNRRSPQPLSLAPRWTGEQHLANEQEGADRQEPVASSRSAPQPHAGPTASANVVPPAAAASSQAFEDELIVHLWTANHRARRRAKKLINGIRAARFHADAMAADLAAMETELDLARAAYDSHMVNDGRLQEELAEYRRQEEQRVALLLQEVSALRAELAESQASIEVQTSDYRRVCAELAELRQKELSPHIGPQTVARVVELEALLQAQSQQLESLTHNLNVAEHEQRRLAKLYQAEAERSARAGEALAQQQSLAVTAAAGSSPASATAGAVEPIANVWQSVPQLEEARAPQQPEPPQATWQAFDPPAEPPLAAPSLAPTASAGIPAVAAWEAPEERLTNERAGVIGETPALHGSAAPMPAEEIPETPSQAIEPPHPAWAASGSVQPAAEYSSTSFIDKYRHLLEDEDAAAAAPLPANGGRAVIDEEYLSPAKAQTCASGSDESDEALEAYMANMMRRVRSHTPSLVADPPAPALAKSAPRAASRFLQPPPESATAAPDASSDFLSEEPLSFEELKQATRKAPLASDLAALREMANSSARTAIATHTHRQCRESAMTKIVVAITATVSAAYLMASAPALDNWQFWAGLGTCAVGITASVQVLMLERRRKQ